MEQINLYKLTIITGKAKLFLFGTYIQVLVKKTYVQTSIPGASENKNPHKYIILQIILKQKNQQ